MPALGAHLMSAGFYSEALGDALTITMGFQNFIKLDPNGSHRGVTLPAEEGNSGAWFYILNSGTSAENLVVYDDTDTPVTIVTIAQNEAAIVTCDGSAWSHMGIMTIALS